MRLYIAKDYNDMSRKAANVFSAQIIMKPDSVLGLATGSSILGIYKQLIEWYKKGDLDFDEISSINLDEYVGLGPEDTQSYAYFMRKNLFDHVNMKPENIHIPNGLEVDADKECKRYNELIKAHGGIDLQLLGIGENGHIGFNEPGSAFEKETHKVCLTDSTINANARFFDSAEEVPRFAYSMGIKAIMQAKGILLVANGTNKAKAIAAALAGPITPHVPASILQLHNNLIVIIDEEAAECLQQ